jgi:hypothetical protein
VDSNAIENALSAVGELISAQKERVAIVVTGGATLNLLGFVDRVTSDVDVIARAHREESGAIVLERAEPFPPVLMEAIRTVARDLGLDPSWMNAGVGKQWSQGLPPGTAEGLTWRNYGGGLDVGLVGRDALIALKLFAVVDSGPRSVHHQDLLLLDPTLEELEQAQKWVVTQDGAASWPRLVQTTVDHVSHER